MEEQNAFAEIAGKLMWLSETRFLQASSVVPIMYEKLFNW